MGSVAILYHHHAVASEVVCAGLWFSSIGEEWKKRGLDDEPPKSAVPRR